ncbi:ribonuclease Z [Spongiibacter sp. KMU-158]|uniref:Ribonuclease Z n=1 Tax=Spongiibacter pelagi TaxID=2760804 RepID=A0A927BYB1_9GAMM|nr:ribonuclease Z [Spongiibacter pelagi]MBD2857790.1 ribonuclease Z [Spongiibacter pelagi]
MRLTFLGTSAGAPTPYRNVTGLCLAIEDSRDWYLFDCGEGSQQQLLNTRYSAARLQAIFISHVHGDHCYGLPGLIASANMHGRTAPLTICAPDGIEQFVRTTFMHTDVNNLRFELNFVRSDQPGFFYRDKYLDVSAIALSHRVPSYAYHCREHPPYHLEESQLDKLGVPRGPMWNRLQKGQDQRLEDGSLIRADDVRHPAWAPRQLIIGGDNDQPELLASALPQCQLLVHEATFTEDVLARVGSQYMHSTAAMVAKAAAQAELPNLILTHISQRYRLGSGEHIEHSVEDLRAEARQSYTGQLFMAEDLESYELDREGALTIRKEQN